MRKVTLYIECSSTYIGKKLRLSGYVLEYITRDLPVTGQPGIPFDDRRRPGPHERAMRASNLRQ